MKSSMVGAGDLVVLLSDLFDDGAVEVATRLAAASAGTALLTACGGGDDDDCI